MVLAEPAAWQVFDVDDLKLLPVGLGFVKYSASIVRGPVIDGNDFKVSQVWERRDARVLGREGASFFAEKMTDTLGTDVVSWDAESAPSAGLGADASPSGVPGKSTDRTRPGKALTPSTNQLSSTRTAKNQNHMGR